MGDKRDASLIRRMEAWWIANQHEWLTLEDMQIKFNANRQQIKDAIHRLNDREGSVELQAIVVYRVRE